MSSRSIRKAIVPAAGRGTRLQPFSLVVPKELAPLGGRPALDFVLTEAATAGIEEVAIVTRTGKELLERFVHVRQDAEAWPGLEVHFVSQPEPLGLGDAITRCRTFCGDEAFALLLPDNLPLAPDYRLDTLLAPAARTGMHVLAVLELDTRHSGLYGRSGLIDYQARDDGTLLLERLLPKQPGTLTIAPGETVRRTCGRYACQPDLFDALDEVRSRTVGELDEVPAYQLLVDSGRVLGRPVPMPLFDVGHGAGLLAASAWLATRASEA